MKGLKMFLLVVLFLGIFLQHSHSARAPNVGEECCNAYVKGAIPLSKVVTWYKTPEGCRKEAIVFITVLKKFICTNPKERWVKMAIKSLLTRDNQKAGSNPENNSGPQNMSLLSSALPNSQAPFNNSAQLPSRTQLNPSQQTNSTQHLNSTSPLTSSIHLKN